MEKQKCKYCDTKVIDRLRCDTCDFIWNDGVEFGKNLIKFELRNMKNKLLNLMK